MLARAQSSSVKKALSLNRKILSWATFYADYLCDCMSYSTKLKHENAFEKLGINHFLLFTP